MLVFAAVSASLALAVSVQDPATLGAPPHEGDLLSGPRVRDSVSESKTRRPSLVTRGFDGEIVRVGPEPGADALEAMRAAGGEWALDEAETRALDAVAVARAAALDVLLRANGAQLLELQGISARATSPSLVVRLGAVLDLGRTMHAFTPYFDRGGFLDEFARAEGVRPATVAKAREIETRYITALVRSAMAAKSGAGVKPEGETAIRIRLRLEHFGALIKQAIERKVGLAQAEFDAFATALSLDGAMKEKVRAELGPLFIADLAGKATPAMRVQVVGKVYAMLTPDQRRTLLAYLSGRNAR